MSILSTFGVFLSTICAPDAFGLVQIAASHGHHQHPARHAGTLWELCPLAPQTPPARVRSTRQETDMQTDINTAKYPTDHADMRPTVSITRTGKTWCLAWGEPVHGNSSLWWAYQRHCAATLVPALRARWGNWCALAENGGQMELVCGSFGCLSRAPEAAVRDGAAIIRAVFPLAVVSWPKARERSRQRCDQCRHMSADRRCTQPAAAWLADKGLPVWCDLMGGNGRTCHAFIKIDKEARQ